MSRLEKLIRELCPNGVEYKPLIDILKIKNGRDYKKFSEGNIPVYGSGGIIAYIDRFVYDKPSVLIPRKGSIDKLYYVDTPFWTVDTIFYTEINTKIAEPKFLYFSLKKQRLERLNTAGGVPSLTQNVLNKVKIPLPPLEVQREIVRILDSFTLLTEELINELTEEYTARKKQYEYYRDKLLKFDIPISKVKLKDIATDIYRGSEITREQVTEDGIPCVRYGEIYTTYNIWFDECKSHTKIENVANPKYLSYVLSTHNAQQQKSKGKIKSKVVHSSVPAIEEIEIPLPDLDVQNRLVNVLDNFDSICTDLNIGLSAEIKARQKQYEYYRDLLLTFVERSNTILTDRQTLIKLLQYVFGYVVVELKDVASYSSERIEAGLINENTYIGVENLLQDRCGKIQSSCVPIEGRLIRYSTEDILIGNIRPYLKKIWFADCCGGTNGDVLVIQGNTDLIYPRFLYMVLCSDKFFDYDMQNSKGAKMPRGNKEAVMRYQFCMPVMQKQKEIVEILDRFDVLCNDISEGLPAEIEARQKQYEYYRDKLLTFKELNK